MAATKTRRQTRRHGKKVSLAESPADEPSSQAEEASCEAERISQDNQEKDRASLAELPTVQEADEPDKSPAGNEEISGGKEGEQEEDKEEEEEQEEDEDTVAAENDFEEGQLLLTDYEKQREKRLMENAAKLASLNLPSLASSVQTFTRTRRQRKSTVPKKRVDDDYVPSSSSDSQDSNDAHPHDRPDSQDTGPQIRQDGMEHFDEDQALQQAITLSLGTNADKITNITDNAPRTGKNRKQAVDKKGTAKKKRKGMQGQYTTEEIAAIFTVIDEQRNGKFSAAELERVVRSHDFMWSQQEIADMIDIFDSNKDGQLDLMEFQSIFGRINMLKMDTT